MFNMFNIILLIYIADVVASVQVALVLIAAACVISAMSCCMSANTMYPEDPLKNAYVTKWRNRMVVGCILAGMLAAFIPSKKAVYAIAAVYAADQLSQPELAQKTKIALERVIDQIATDPIGATKKALDAVTLP